jgi:hypothetical protein
MTVLRKTKSALAVLWLLSLAACAADVSTAEHAPKPLDHLTLTVDKKVLYLVRKEHDMATLILTAFYTDGSQSILHLSKAVVTIRTKQARSTGLPLISW